MISDALYAYGFCDFLFFSDAFNCRNANIFNRTIKTISTACVICVLMYVYPKFERDPSSTSQVIANYISVELAVALSIKQWAL